MIARHGYPAPETKSALLRAKSLIDDSTSPSHKFAVLYGIWAGQYVGGEVAKQGDAAVELLAEAERYDDAAALCMGHRTLGTTYVARLNLSSACDTSSERERSMTKNNIRVFVTSTARTSGRLRFAI
jgi:hypothetical protein